MEKNDVIEIPYDNKNSGIKLSPQEIEESYNRYSRKYDFHTNNLLEQCYENKGQFFKGNLRLDEIKKDEISDELKDLLIDVEKKEDLSIKDMFLKLIQYIEINCKNKKSVRYNWFKKLSESLHKYKSCIFEEQENVKNFVDIKLEKEAIIIKNDKLLIKNELLLDDYVNVFIAKNLQALLHVFCRKKEDDMQTLQRQSLYILGLMLEDNFDDVISSMQLFDKKLSNTMNCLRKALEQINNKEELNLENIIEQIDTIEISTGQKTETMKEIFEAYQNVIQISA